MAARRWEPDRCRIRKALRLPGAEPTDGQRPAQIGGAVFLYRPTNRKELHKMNITTFAIAAGQFTKNKSCRSCATAADLRRELQDVPGSCRLAIYHNGKPAPVFGTDKTPGALELIEGEDNNLSESLTVAQLQRRLVLLPDSCPVFVALDGQRAPVYGFNKIAGE